MFKIWLCSCKPGFYNLDANLTLGCLSCFCFGHSIECKSSSNHVGFNIDASFSDEDWTSIDSNDQVASLVFDKLADGIYIYNKDKDIWFNAPSRSLVLFSMKFFFFMIEYYQYKF